MNAFQIIIVVGLSLLVISTVRGASRGLVRKRIAVFWLLVWISAGITTLWPQVTVLVARKLGVGRGADLVMYCSVLMTLVGFFYIYTRFRRMDHAITLLVRQLAIERARAPKDGDEGSR